MKRVGYVFEKIVDIENIKTAIKNSVRRKKHKTKLMSKMLVDLDKYAKKIQVMILDENFEFSPFIEKTIRERQKIRNLKVPRFYPDQIIHWSVVQVVQPIVDKGIYKYCCGSVKGRGGLSAKKAVEKFQNKTNRKQYVLKADIRHFFDNVDVEILKQKFRTKIKDKKALSLIDKILDHGAPGLPIGFYPSQGFSNFYLQAFDDYVKHELKIQSYVRYVDDIVLFDTNKRKMRKARVLIESFLKKENLTLKPNWQIWRLYSRPIDFVGYRFYKGYTLLRKHIFYSLIREVRKAEKNGITLRTAYRFLSFMGYARHINFKNYYLKNIKNIISLKDAKKKIAQHDRAKNRRKYETD